MKKYKRVFYNYRGNIDDFLKKLDKEFPNYRLIQITHKEYTLFESTIEVHLAILEREIEDEESI